MNIFNADCFDIFPDVEDKSIDLFVLDLPYANDIFGKCTACKWDDRIDLDKMWIEIKRMMKPNANIIFFCNIKLGFALINSNMKWFRYELIWKKSRKVGFLSANKKPLVQHEYIYVFGNDTNEEYNDLEISRNKELRQYSKTIYDYINKTKKEIIKDIGQSIDHFFRFKSSQFGIPTEKTYNQLIDLYKINEMNDFIEYNELKEKWEKSPPKEEQTYNSQKTEGKPYKMKEGKILTNNAYGTFVRKGNNKGDRHPTSILEYQEPNHEYIYVFGNDTNEEYNDLEISRNKELRQYAEKVKKYINKSLNQINKDFGNRHAEHFFYIKSSQFSIPTEETYNQLIQYYKINEMNDFMEYNELKEKWEKSPLKEKTYNPQKTEGKPYKTKEASLTNSYYRDGKKEYKTIPKDNKGDRHPSTILEFNNPKKSLHTTMKPTDLLEWIIKSYSNENDLVMDFTMGSGSTGEACKNTNRRFIGIEKDEHIFKIAENRLKQLNI